MRIGFDAKRYFLNKTGLGNYSRDLIRILKRYDNKNGYLLYTPKIKGTSFLQTDIAEITKLPKCKLERILSSFWRGKWIVNDLIEDNIEIFHGLSGEIPIGLQKNNIKSIVTIHDLIFLKYPELYNRIDRFIYRKKLHYALNNADKIVAISEQTKKDIINFFQISPDKIIVIYQGCHPSFKLKRTKEEKENLRIKYSLPKRFLLNVGSIEPRKNVLSLVKAIENIDIPLLIIGKKTNYTAEIEAYIEQKGMQDKVKMMQGFTMDELAIIYSMSEIFIYPSLYEGFGIPIIEALYSGTPVITNKYGVFPEAGGSGSYYINPENVNELAEAITMLLIDKNKRIKMIETGYEYAQKFNDEVLAKQWIELYQFL